MSRPQAARGTEDLFPERIPAHEHVFAAFRRTVEAAAFREIRTPMLEDTSLFVRSLGEVTDVVEKEMFTCTRGDTSVTFRPEGTAPVVRAYLQANLDKTRPYQKLYYVGPMFRFERPQAGRQRQFYQCGVEALGSQSPLLDAEVAALAVRSFEAMGLRNFALHVNSIGDRGDRETFREVLRAYMEPHLPDRCDDCKARYTRNVFRMLDCKVKGCQPSNQSAPRFIDHLGADSRDRFHTTLRALEAIGVKAEVDPSIVRGFDYYTHTVYEVQCSDLGARSAICGGGRYDTLVPDLGGGEVGATGFAIGVTPTLLALEKQAHAAVAPQDSELPVFVAPIGDEERLAAFRLCDRLRAAGLVADTDYEQRSLKAQMRAADKRNVRLVLMLGTEEVAQGRVKVKHMASGSEVVLPDDEALPPALRRLLEDRDDGAMR
ncbi:MAG: histidine--tRNA ligase [Planctomycetota bacterium]